MNRINLLVLGLVAGGCSHPAPRSSADPPTRPDFSYAGYHAGERPIPHVPVRANVGDFGARGDGVADDAPAVSRAIESAGRAGGGAVVFPPGRYRLSGMLRLDTDGVVLRGAGRQAATGTTLLFDRDLATLRGPDRQWSWTGGLIWVGPPADAGRELTRITADARRGDQELLVASPDELRVGQLVEMRLHNTEADPSLLRHIFGGREPEQGSVLKGTGYPGVLWKVEIAAVEGNRILLSQPLRVDCRTAWSPALFDIPCVREVGIEHLRIECASPRYRGHLQETGWNAIFFRNVHNGWVRHVTIRECDSGVICEGAKSCTARDIDIEGRIGHYGFQCRVGTSDCLFARFRIVAPRVHALSVSHRSSGNVFTSGEVLRVTCDAHRDAPIENLYDNLVVRCTRGYRNPLASGGDADRYGPCAGVRHVYWNLRFEGDATSISPGPLDEFPQAHFVGWHGDVRMEFPDIPPGTTVERLGLPADPPSLYEHQRARRLGDRRP